jgi:predicted GNAT family acetyltransferase
MHPLDRPVWHSLATHHAVHAEGGPAARRYAHDTNLFAAARDDAPEALAALAALVRPGERVYLLQAAGIVVPAGLRVVQAATGVQMVGERRLGAPDTAVAIVPLQEADAPAMLALATLTQPGPFLARTHVLGRFRGVKAGAGDPGGAGAGALLAMAGERLRLPGYTEVSGVCTHPAARGRGLARALSMAVAAEIQARGDIAFLHAWKANQAAIHLYESLGFVRRTEVHVAVLERPSA